MFEVYLAGRISGKDYDDANKLRKEFIEKAKEIDVKCRTPLRGKSWLKSEGIIEKKAVEKKLTLQEIILRDLHDIDRVNCVVILTGDDPSWGTSGEFWYSTWIAKKPTLVIAETYMGGWLDYFSTKIVPNIDEAIEVLRDWSYYWDDGEGIHEEA